MNVKRIVFSLFVLIGVYFTSLIITNSANAYRGGPRRYRIEFRCRRGGLRRYFRRYGHLKTQIIRARHRDMARRRAHPILRDRCGGRPYRIESIVRIRRHYRGY